MKIKKVLIAFLVVLCLFSMTSCLQINDLREKQYFLSEDKTEITHDDKVYKVLYLPDELDLNDVEFDEINITKKDVPVLLSEHSNIATAFISKDKSNIKAHVFGERNGYLYVESSEYRNYSEMSENIELEKYGFLKYDSIGQKFVTFDEEIENIINTSLSFSVPKEENELINNNAYFDSFLDFYKTDKTNTFKSKNIYSIIETNGEYYICLRKISSNLDVYEIPTYYVIKDEYRNIIKNLIISNDYID